MKTIRFAVFVDEQGVPAELELDSTDAISAHALARDSAGQPCATGRVFGDPEDDRRARIGRMAVLPAHRGTGIGAAVLQALLAEARRRGFAEAVLSAQVHAAGFYAKHGFAPVGEVYDDCGIPHQEMVLAL